MSDLVKPVDCLITAAGLSSRMGSWKMMLPFGRNDETILDCSIANALRFCQRVILVTGHRGDEIQQRYQHHSRITQVHNHQYSLGLFTSIQAGVSRCDTDYLFITHGDMPLVVSEIYSSLWEQRGSDTLFPIDHVSSQQAGHPVLLHRSRFEDILEASPSTRMKSLLLKRAHRYIEVSSDAIHQDIDTPDRYQQLYLESQ
ncbi:molybdenum cofactor cytidylyltransferase [Endozoicomonas sp. (ex Bugula neritina AB1)]|nr:molybdenum cofactor cytidylyltransferase [Endozoicomonas sp. (ex Bugula neritina AB1)]